MSKETESIHKAFINFTKRAEKNSDEILVDTFVDSAPLFDLLSTKNNQILYGRRGTGKTHALKYLSESVSSAGDFPIYIDLRTIGSDGAIYHDISKPASERSIRLVIDVVRHVADELYGIAVALIDNAPHPKQITIRLDDLTDAISSVKIVGDISTKESNFEQNQHIKDMQAGIDADTSNLLFKGLLSKKQQSETKSEHEISRVGSQKFHLDFGKLQGSLNGLLEVLGGPTIWILIDEWSEIPIELQPYLADLLRKTLFPINNFIVKIASIEHRSSFSIKKDGGGYLGLELGADISADLNLDDFLVFDNDQDKAIDFFKNLIFRHYQSTAGNDSVVASPNEMVAKVFTKISAFEEFVRAVEGVPRDALNLCSKVSAKAYGELIKVNDIRSGAKDWYENDKASIVKSAPLLADILNYIISEVIGKRRARAFLFPSGIRDQSIEQLFDARILHLLKKNISSHDEPGNRFDVFKVDYGCYVDLINTIRAPKGLFEIDEEEYAEVPVDDYRSIRRAILRPENLTKIINRYNSN